MIDMNLFDDDELLFEEEDEVIESKNDKKWKILIVDDEPEIHSVTTLALSEFFYAKRA
mgnify:FL=1|jgi:hypothetical protein